MARRIKEKAEPKVIGSKKEKKLDIETKVIELEMDNFLNKYDLNNKIETFISMELDKVLNESIMLQNINKTEKEHVRQFDSKFFEKILDFISTEINFGINKELERNDFRCEKTKHIHFEIIKNINTEIELTMFEEKLPKLDLIAYHYLLKVLEPKAISFLKRNNLKNIRGYKISMELFRFELNHILSNHKNLSRFVLTILSIIEQHLTKYNARTKIGSFYYSILMTTKEYIEEKVFKYIIFTALKNMNPIYLRAIFSTYIGLIHTNLFSFFGAKLTKIKVGYYKQLESLFEENFSKDLNSNLISPNQMFLENILITYFMHNKRHLKTNYDFLLNEYSNNFFNPNYYDIIYSYPNDNDVSILDYLFYYNSVLKIVKNNFRHQTNLYNIKNMNNKKNNIALKNYAQDLVMEYFYESLFDLIKDKESTLEICKYLGENIIQNLNPNNFVNENFQKETIGFDDYMIQVKLAVMKLKKIIFKNN